MIGPDVGSNAGGSEVDNHMAEGENRAEPDELVDDDNVDDSRGHAESSARR